MTDKLKVLFLCTKNSARSQMAEGLLRKIAGDKFDVRSAGIEPSFVHPLAQKAMEEIGIDISAHRSKGIKEFLGKVQFDFLITVCASADEQCPAGIASARGRLYWHYDDPAAFEGSEEEKLDKFREIRDKMQRKIVWWLKEMNYTK